MAMALKISGALVGRNVGGWSTLPMEVDSGRTYGYNRQLMLVQRDFTTFKAVP